jgi:AraC-like DNA-binding protein
MAMVVRTADVPTSDRLDLWHDRVCHTLVPLKMTAEATNGYSGELVHHDLGVAQLLDKTAWPLLVERTPRLIRASDPGLYKIELQLRGASVLSQGEREALLGPGQAAVVDTGRPYRMAAGYPEPAVAGDAAPVSALPRLMTLILPQALLPRPVDEMLAVTATDIARQLPTGELIAATLAQLARSAATGDEATAARLVPVVVDLFAVGLAGLRDRAATLSVESRQRALMARIEAFIETHLPDPGLSPDTIAVAHHISLRSLHHLFATHAATTVAAHIRDRRLERCRRSLIDPLHKHRPVAAIATDWGFTSLAHFTRIFHAAYGLPPAAYRRHQENGAVPLSGVTPDQAGAGVGGGR